MRLQRCLDLGFLFENSGNSVNTDFTVAWSVHWTWLVTISNATVSLRKFSEKQDQLGCSGKEQNPRVSRAGQVLAPQQREVGWRHRAQREEKVHKTDKHLAYVVEQRGLGRVNLESCHLGSPSKWRGCSEAFWKAVCHMMVTPRFWRSTAGLHRG